jgi:hypothetical protein
MYFVTIIRISQRFPGPGIGYRYARAQHGSAQAQKSSQQHPGLRIAAVKKQLSPVTALLGCLLVVGAANTNSDS